MPLNIEKPDPVAVCDALESIWYGERHETGPKGRYSPVSQFKSTSLPQLPLQGIHGSMLPHVTDLAQNLERVDISYGEAEPTR